MKVMMLTLLGVATITSAGIAQADTVVHRDVDVHRTIHRAPPHHRWHPVHHRAHHVVVRREVVRHEDHR